jgi:membrane-associated phospholipid phosphatase
VTTMDKFKAALQSRDHPLVKRVAEGVQVSIKWLQRKPRPVSPSHSQWPIREQWIAITLFTIGAAVACMFFADGAATLNSKRLPQLLVDTSNQFTDFGKSVWFLWPSALVLAACALAGASAALTRTQHRVLAAIAVRAQFVFISVAVPGLVTALIKRVLGRARPLVVDWHIPHPFVYTPFTGKGDFNSMPSGHATAAVSAAIVLGSLWPKARPYLWIYAVYICISRVIGLSHHVSDVLIGALIGAGGAVLIRNAYAARGLIFYRDELGQATAKPGPSWRRIKALARAIRGP